MGVVVLRSKEQREGSSFVDPVHKKKRRGKDILVPPSLTFGQFRPQGFDKDNSDPQGLHFGQFNPTRFALWTVQTLWF